MTDLLEDFVTLRCFRILLKWKELLHPCYVKKTFGEFFDLEMLFDLAKTKYANRNVSRRKSGWISTLQRLQMKSFQSVFRQIFGAKWPQQTTFPSVVTVNSPLRDIALQNTWWSFTATFSKPLPQNARILKFSET